MFINKTTQTAEELAREVRFGYQRHHDSIVSGFHPSYQPIVSAALKGEIDHLTQLLQQEPKIDLNQKDISNDYTLLMHLARTKHIENIAQIVDLLMENGAYHTRNHQSKINGRTAFFCALNPTQVVLSDTFMPNSKLVSKLLEYDTLTVRQSSKTNTGFDFFGGTYWIEKTPKKIVKEFCQDFYTDYQSLQELSSIYSEHETELKKRPSFNVITFAATYEAVGEGKGFNYYEHLNNLSNDRQIINEELRRRGFGTLARKASMLTPIIAILPKSIMTSRSKWMVSGTLMMNAFYVTKPSLPDTPLNHPFYMERAALEIFKKFKQDREVIHAGMEKMTVQNMKQTANQFMRLFNPARVPSDSHTLEKTCEIKPSWL